jgi:serine/threonine-protein phosphatase CPPED1
MEAAGAADYGPVPSCDEERFSAAQRRVLEGMGRAGLRAQWEATGPFTFVQLADTQFGMLDSVAGQQRWRLLRYALRLLCCFSGKEKGLIPVPRLNRPSGAPATGPLLPAELALARRAVRAINAFSPRPAFAVVCGDLVHSFPDTQPARHAAEVTAFKNIFSEVHPDIALVCICGNHDIGERPTPATISTWRSDFGDDYFSFWVGGVKFVALNSQLYKNATGEGATELAAEQDRWLDAELTLAQAEGARRVVVLSHIPPFISEPDEPSGYFPLPRDVRLRLLTRMARAGVTHWCAELPRAPPTRTPQPLPCARIAGLLGTTTATLEGCSACLVRTRAPRRTRSVPGTSRARRRQHVTSRWSPPPLSGPTSGPTPRATRLASAVCATSPQRRRCPGCGSCEWVRRA